VWPRRMQREREKLLVSRTTRRSPQARRSCPFPVLEANLVSPQVDGLWVDKYVPQTLQDLAVHKRKVDDVRRWLVEAFNEKGRSKRRVSRHNFFAVPNLA